MTTVYLALGSNQGDRAALLDAAVAALVARGVPISARSSIYETAAVADHPQPPYLNQVVCARTSLSPKALLAAGIQPGDSVITTPFSFFATASSIVRLRARPVFIDIEDGTLNLDPALVRAQAVRVPKLSAIMPVHLYGQCAEMDSFSDIASELKIAIVEDSAQAFGATWRGRRAGTLGHSAAFSFYPTKNLSAFGDAGCATAPAPLAARMRSLRNHGSASRYYHDEIGWNTRLDGIQAAVLRVKLKHLEKWNQQRRERAATYDKLLRNSGLLGTSGKLRMLEIRKEAEHIFHQYVVRAERRDELRSFLSERGIGSEVYYPVPLHLQKCFAYLGYREGDLPVSEKAAREVLALPMFAEITEDEQQAVVEAIAEFYS